MSVTDRAAQTADSTGRPRVARGGAVGRLARAYLTVLKPRIVELLVVTTIPTMVVAAGGWPGTWRVLATLIGGSACAGAANAANNVLDRDVDRLMGRTRDRPTATEAISPRAGLAFAGALGMAGAVWLATLVGPAAAGFAVGAILFYVFVYTLWLKRRTPQAVVIGGLAGCAPVLVGWAAVPGASLADPRPWVLFALLFAWQPPHFWALALKYRDEYRAAGLPMLPSLYGTREAASRILLHSWLLLPLVLLYVAGARAGWWFAAPALALTAVWLVLAHRLHRAPDSVRRAMQLFHYSTAYLALLFTAAAVDAVLAAPLPGG